MQPSDINTQALSIDFFAYFYTYAPSAILLIGAIVVLLANVFARHFSRSNSIALSAIFIIFTLLTCLSLGHSSSIARLSFVAEIMILLSGLAFILLSFSRYRFVEFQTQEFYPLYLFSLCGFLIMVCAQNFIVLLLGLEIGSLPLCAMMAFSRRVCGIEAGVKYFVSSALASMFLLLGVMLLYLYGGSLEISFAMQKFAQTSYFDTATNNLLALSGAMFVLAALGFKVSLIPWHTWMPDSYEGSNALLAGYISIVPKIAGFIVLFAIFSPIFGSNLFIDKLFKILLILTITLPNIAALLQKDIKRMLAFSSISHSGFALACVYFDNTQALIAYWVLFSITNIGSFALLWCNTPKGIEGRYDYSFERFYGLGSVRPIMAISMSVFMFALAGIPPLTIFWGKVLVINAAFSNGENLLAILMMLNSAIAVCYYLKLPVAMFFKGKDSKITNFIESSSLKDSNFLQDSKFSESNSLKDSNVSESNDLKDSKVIESNSLKNANFIESKGFKDSKISESNDFKDSNITESSSVKDSNVSESNDLKDSKFIESNSLKNANFIESKGFKDSNFMESKGFKDSNVSESKRTKDSSFTESSSLRDSNFTESSSVKDSNVSESNVIKDSKFSESNSLKDSKFSEFKRKDSKFIESNMIKDSKFYNSNADSRIYIDNSTSLIKAIIIVCLTLTITSPFLIDPLLSL